MPQNPQQLQQQRLNESIEQVRKLMQNLKGVQNPQQILMNVLENNPQTAQLAKLFKNNNLESIARQMAQSEGVNILDVINSLLR